MRTTEDRFDEQRRAIDYVLDFFAPVPNLFVRQYQSEGSHSVVISTQETLTPDVLMLGHLDVVGSPDEYFEPRIEGPIMRGRGVCDMKAEDAVMMVVMQEIVTWNTRPNIALMLTCDEEIGGFNGAKYLAEEIGYRAKVVLCPDGSDNPETLIHKNKASWIIRVHAHGASAHGSRPWLGDNAILKLMRAYERIRELFPQEQTPERWERSCTVSKISGGLSINQVPESAECVLDVRLTENDDPYEFIEQIKQAAVGCQIQILEEGRTSYTAPDNQYIALYKQVVKDILDKETTLIASCGADDGRYFASHDVPVLCSRPISGDMHSNHEWVHMDSIKDFYDIYVEFIRRATQSSTR